MIEPKNRKPDLMGDVVAPILGILFAVMALVIIANNCTGG